MLNILNPFWKYICAVLSASSLILSGVVWFEGRQIHRWHLQNDKNVAARLADQARYAQAQKDAATQNDAQVRQVEQQQQKVTDDVETRYRSDLARLRADNARLRAQGPAPQRTADKPGSSAPVARPGGPTCETVSLPAAELLRAQETELQLNALIDLVNQQSNINPNELREPQH